MARLAVVEEMRLLINIYLLAEFMDGMSSNAQLFLRKPHYSIWCSPSITWSDTGDAVTLVAEVVARDSRDNKESRNRVVNYFHAENDRMVGEKERLWFDACWETIQSVSACEEEPNRNIIEYRSETVRETNRS